MQGPWQSVMCAHWTLSAVLMYYGPYRPNLVLLSDSVLLLTSPLNSIKLCCRLSWLPLLLPVQPSHVHPTNCYMLGSEMPEDEMLLLLAWDKAFKSLGQRFPLDCSWTWKASQTRIHCESYRMIQLLLVTLIPSLDTVTVNTQRTADSIQRDKIWNDR